MIITGKDFNLIKEFFDLQNQSIFSRQTLDISFLEKLLELKNKNKKNKNFIKDYLESSNTTVDKKNLVTINVYKLLEQQTELTTGQIDLIVKTFSHEKEKDILDIIKRYIGK